MKRFILVLGILLLALTTACSPIEKEVESEVTFTGKVLGSSVVKINEVSYYTIVYLEDELPLSIAGKLDILLGEVYIFDLRRYKSVYFDGYQIILLSICK